MNNQFGKYLKYLRSSRNPQMSQESLGNAIGRCKMTISQFEQGKNAPPNGELLKKIIKTLELSFEEESMLCFLSAKARKEIPTDIEMYFFENPDIYIAIKKVMKNHRLINWKTVATSEDNSYEKISKRY